MSESHRQAAAMRVGITRAERTISDETKALVKQYRELGWSAPKIAQALDISSGGVYYILNPDRGRLAGRLAGAGQRRRVAKSLYFHSMRLFHLSRGRCGKCWVSPREGKKERCIKCLKEAIQYTAQAQKAANDRGLCRTCLTRPREGIKIRCTECLEKDRVRSQQKRRAQNGNSPVSTRDGAVINTAA